MAETGGRHIPGTTMTEDQLEVLMTRASKAGAKEALCAIGLKDETAAADVRELRLLLAAWRDAKKTVRTTIVKYVTTAVLVAISAGVGISFWGGGGK